MCHEILIFGQKYFSTKLMKIYPLNHCCFGNTVVYLLHFFHNRLEALDGKLVFLTWMWFLWGLLAHLVYQPKSLIQSCFVHCHHWHHPASVSVLSSVHTSPWHMVRHGNFILSIHMHICHPYMHIKYLMILTCSF